MSIRARQCFLTALSLNKRNSGKLFSTSSSDEEGGRRMESFQAPNFMEIGSRRYLTHEHDTFREGVRKIVDKEVRPKLKKWDSAKHTSQDFWRMCGDHGMLGLTIPHEYGGPGGNIWHASVIWDEFAYGNCMGPGIGLGVHSEIVCPYILHYGSEAMKQELLPDLCSGKKIGAIAMTEPQAGSDLQGMRTYAVKSGSDWIITGSKMYITNGFNADFVICVAKTGPKEVKAAHGLSLFVVPKGTPGYSSGNPLHKMGQSGSDTTELYFDNVKVPATAMLGELNKGFYYLMTELPLERLMISGLATASSEAIFEWTRKWCEDRKAFGGTLSHLQTVRHKMAEMKTEIAIGRTFCDQCIQLFSEGRLDSQTASMAKYWLTELNTRVADTGLQLHGGAGYCWDTDVCRAAADARVQRIYGGANEIMKELISRSVFP